MTQSELLNELNRFTRREHTMDEVYIFDVVLCDNNIDRDGDCFSYEALKDMQQRFLGVTGVFDSNEHKGNLTARIFYTEIFIDPKRKNAGTDTTYCKLRAWAYMVRTDSNADLIREIEAGIKNEVSISCAVNKQICSICGANRLKNPCEHINGKIYNGDRCYTTLEGILDVYEWSFVVPPVQFKAGTIKTYHASREEEQTSSPIQRAKVVQLFSIFSNVDDVAPWQGLIDESIKQVDCECRPDADRTDIRLCYYAAALANLYYRTIYAGQRPNFASGNGESLVLAERLVDAYRDASAGLLTT